MVILLTLFTAIVGGILFPFISYLGDRKKGIKPKNHYIIQGALFAAVFFMVLMTVKPISN
ncbi:hypothetical protein QUF84_08725 [Fictibacillus enclensis]|uniref:Uncharacterized protein n=1 Tax=Fictibacillus enclensis TaxID=1017270 RepID=A0A0V8JCT3_9BACL|nr:MULTISPECIES: hypothetical protein [Fictibacillus]KSU84448.1 hypothetical protein AS030_02535 [Fictibacillus enclensis]MDM5198152.1 hypothetical protein [Fictibacillus enclensis]MDM5337298.1 hypothetical protein [Fictibacillus enclensis]RXY99918.1 hypothetical protein DMO16_09625 [Fictibacillus sp. S7]WHY73725.1 hypothetical protein QNH15_07360 [Fictibacillus enclensis]